jgi:hypothetical protein
VGFDDIVVAGEGNGVVGMCGCYRDVAHDYL